MEKIKVKKISLFPGPALGRASGAVALGPRFQVSNEPVLTLDDDRLYVHVAHGVLVLGCLVEHQPPGHELFAVHDPPLFRRFKLVMVPCIIPCVQS